MTLIDLSRDIHHKMQRLPNHPMVIIAPFTDHSKNASSTATNSPRR